AVTRQQNRLQSLRRRQKANGWKSKRIFSLMNSTVKQNPSPEQNFSGIVQNSAYDLQKLCTTNASTLHDSFQKSASEQDQKISLAKSLLLASLGNESLRG